ncbi:MAG TPA: hypothetical protein VKW06_00465 [Candidatus Angelobacter sp.]|nr:hypothetical protein [Candidatus Angelobacter sp.]
MDWTRLSEMAVVGSSCGAVIVAAYKVMKLADRLIGILRDFPPHRHVNGHIIYPDGYEPTAIEELQKSNAMSAGA